jgi:hypothetical protein
LAAALLHLTGQVLCFLASASAESQRIFRKVCATVRCTRTHTCALRACVHAWRNFRRFRLSEFGHRRSRVCLFALFSAETSGRRRAAGRRGTAGCCKGTQERTRTLGGGPAHRKRPKASVLPAGRRSHRSRALGPLPSARGAFLRTPKRSTACSAPPVGRSSHGCPRLPR